MVTPQPTLQGGHQADLAELMKRVADWRRREPDEDDVRTLSLKLKRLVHKCRRLYYTKELAAIRFTLPLPPADSREGYMAADDGPDTFGLEHLAELLYSNPTHELFDCFTAAQRSRIYALSGLRGILISTETDALAEQPSFTHNEAEACTKAFEEFLEFQKDKLAALRFIYQGTMQQEQLLAEHLEELLSAMQTADSRFKPATLWQHYQVLRPAECGEAYGHSSLLGNLIQLVRYAAHLSGTLDDFGRIARRNYELWLGRKINAGIIFTDEQRELLAKVRDMVIYQFAGDINRMKTVDASLYPQCFKAQLHTYLPELTSALIA